jgi:hypothetical protein
MGVADGSHAHATMQPEGRDEYQPCSFRAMRRDTADAAGRSAEAVGKGQRRLRRSRAWIAVALAVSAGAAVTLLASGTVRPPAGRGVGYVAATVAFVLAWVVRPAPDPERWLRGAAGERATAELLERLPPRRWVVLHDRAIPGCRANIDHVVVGPTGVWVIDSKSFRATLRAGWRSVEVGGRRLDTGPAAWEASVVAAHLGYPAVPLIVVHGHGLPRRGRRCRGVRVVPATGLLRRLQRGRRRLGRGDVAALAERCDDEFRPATARRLARTSGRSDGPRSFRRAGGGVVGDR